MNLFSVIKRAWRSKGFGIHSPFAFYFITRVLRERLPYYAFAQIEEQGSEEMPVRHLLTIFRIVCYFAPEVITLPVSAPTAVRDTLRLADSRIRFIHEPSRFQCLSGDMPRDEFRYLAGHVIKDGGVLVIYRPGEEGDFIKDALTCGMTFTNGNASMMVVNVRRDLPRQDFIVNF